MKSKTAAWMTARMDKTQMVYSQSLNRSNSLTNSPTHRLIAAESVTRWHFRAEQSQIHAELAAMLIPVIEHHAAQERHAQLGHDRSIALHNAEDLVHALVADRWQYLSHIGSAVLQRIQNFAQAGRLLARAEIRRRC